jgi:hypothetical protein
MTLVAEVHEDRADEWARIEVEAPLGVGDHLFERAGPVGRAR